MNNLSKSSTVLMWILSFGVALVSYRFIPLGLETAFGSTAAHITERKLAFLLHISASPVALVLGVIQFRPKLRAKRPGLHRWVGRFYALAILIGGGSGLVLALGSTDRPIAAAGFGLLAVLWLATTIRAIYLARERRITEHRRWMIRSFALTFAAVTLRLQLPFLIGIGGMDYAQASIYVSWLCWVPNLLIAEIYLRRGQISSPAPVAT